MIYQPKIHQVTFNPFSILLTLGLTLCISGLSACHSNTANTGKPISTTESPLTIGQQNWQTLGLEQPESVVFDSAGKQYFVSNISGKPTELNGKGFISRVGLDGKLIEKYWITGLNAPKGMAKSGNLLFVADMQQLHIIDIKKGNIKRTITEKTSKMLNDISIDSQDNVYVSDLLGGGIYKLTKKNTPKNSETLNKWITSDKLPLTNGLLLDGKRLLVATWGKSMQADFSTKVLGGLYAVDLKTKNITPLVNAQQIGNLDGIVKIGDHIIVNDWINGKIFDYSNDNIRTLYMAEKTSADIGTDGKNLLIPVMMQNKLVSYSLKNDD